MAENDLYAALGISRSATTNEIKRAYRKLARKHHPDLNPGDKKAEARFKEISEAHDVLGDPEKRKRYDEFGMAGVQAGFDAGQARAYRQQEERLKRAAAGRAYGGREGFGGYARFEDIFGDVFGPEGPSTGPGRGADFEHELEIGLLGALRGRSTAVEIERPQPCGDCAGRGFDAASGTACAECGGTGRVQSAKGPVTFTRSCRKCGGSGRSGVRPCPQCGGRGHTTRKERLTIHIPAGVDTGSRVRIAGKGAPGANGGPPGDLFIRIRVRPHPTIERKGDDLYMDVPITVAEAVAGASIAVPTPDGTVRVHVPPGSQSGRRLRIKGHGAPQLKGAERGNLYLRLLVRVPEKASDDVKAAAQRMDAGYERDVRADLKV